jgi:carbonic anhydrase
MTNLEELLQNNTRFAATDVKNHQPPIPFIPRKQAYLLTCIDPRVEPAQVFGLELGDAIVARTVGGRVTPAVLEDLAWISYLHETKTPEAEWFELAVVHHTECGSGFFADEQLRHDFAVRRDAGAHHRFVTAAEDEPGAPRSTVLKRRTSSFGHAGTGRIRRVYGRPRRGCAAAAFRRRRCATG